jgi:hypothetical protein
LWYFYITHREFFLQGTGCFNGDTSPLRVHRYLWQEVIILLHRPVALWAPASLPSTILNPLQPSSIADTFKLALHEHPGQIS